MNAILISWVRFSPQAPGMEPSELDQSLLFLSFPCYDTKTKHSLYQKLYLNTGSWHIPFLEQIRTDVRCEKTLLGFSRTVRRFYAWQITQIAWEELEDKGSRRARHTKAQLLTYSALTLSSPRQPQSPAAFFLLILFLVCWPSINHAVFKTQLYFGLLSHFSM